jgi:hypothetical protein
LFVKLLEQVDEISISDVSGRLVQRFTPTSTEFNIDLREEPSGSYLLRARIGKNVFTQPLMIRR